MKTIQDAMKAPKGLGKGPKGLGKLKPMKPATMGGKLPTLKDLKIPSGGLLNKDLRKGYGQVPGLDS